jgi:imidazolonepropionase-like amidohydrolase
MSRISARQAATTHAAQLLHHDKELGSISAGKYADVVAVQGDPLADISLLRDVRFVMKAGTVYKRDGAAVPLQVRAEPMPAKAQGEELEGY